MQTIITILRSLEKKCALQWSHSSIWENEIGTNCQPFQTVPAIHEHATSQSNPWQTQCNHPPHLYPLTFTVTKSHSIWRRFLRVWYYTNYGSQRQTNWYPGASGRNRRNCHRRGNTVTTITTASRNDRRNFTQVLTLLTVVTVSRPPDHDQYDLSKLIF